MNNNPKPFLKWAGGKRSIVNRLIENMPDNYNHYYEIFLGAGALFCEIAQTEHKKHISDLNADLINVYKVLRDNYKELVKTLNKMQIKHSEDYFYYIRGKQNSKNEVFNAARFIFINKTGYNGLIRYNSKGEINTPWGHKKGPIKLYDEDNLYLFSQLLKNVDLKCCSYEKHNPKKGDFVYLDPPYHKTYTSYNKGGFDEEKQIELADYYKKLTDKGVLCMLSNANTELIRDLYKDYNIIKIKAPRYISCKSADRHKEMELLILNYDKSKSRSTSQ